MGWVLGLLALVLAGVGMSSDLDGPWRRGWLGHNGARYAQLARNYARDGFLYDGGAPRLDTRGTDPSRPEVYAHHPPGVSLLVGAVFAWVGESERAARLVSGLATLCELLLLFLLVRRVAGSPVAGLACLLTAAIPMTVVFGTHVEVQGPEVLAAGLAVLLCYERARRGARWWPFGVALAVASAFDWYGLYYGAGCAVHAAWARSRRPRLGFGLGAFTLALFAGWVGWLGSLPGMTPGSVFSAAGVRVDGGPGALDPGRPGLLEQLGVRLESLADLLPWLPALLVLVLGVLLVGRLWDTARCGSALSPRWLLALLAGPPLIHAVLFPAGLAVHSYWLFGLPPALALTLALLLERLTCRAPARVAGALALLLGSGLAAGGVSRLAAARQPVDELPALVGATLAAQVPAGELVLTNYGANPLRWGQPGDVYHVRLPEVSYYADLPVRGGVDRPERLAEALERLPRARWFLLAPFPAPEQQAALEARLRQISPDSPRLLSGDPPVTLYSLRR